MSDPTPEAMAREFVSDEDGVMGFRFKSGAHVVCTCSNGVAPEMIENIARLLEAHANEVARACERSAIDSRDTVDKGIKDGKWPELPEASPVGMRNGLNAAALGIRARFPGAFKEEE